MQHLSPPRSMTDALKRWSDGLCRVWSFRKEPKVGKGRYDDISVVLPRPSSWLLPFLESA